MTADRYRYFRVEARDLLEELNKGALELDKGAAPSGLIARLLRITHTLKGAARVVKQKEIADHAHSIEDCLAPFRESANAPPRERISAMLRELDGVAEHLAALAPQPASESADARSVAADSVAPPVRADVEELDSLLDGLAETSVRFAELRRALTSLERGRHLAKLLEEQLASPMAPRLDGSASRLRSVATELRVLVEDMQRMLGSGAEQTDRELRQVRDTAERLRLVPARFMFVALERAARDAALSLGKRVIFETRGGEIRLDAHILAAVQAALVQAVRNAVAHGIEMPAQRETAGKAPEGRIAVEVSRRGSHAAFVCRDDGRGVDIEAVRGALQRKGMAAEGTAALDGQAMLDLLLRGGISTSADVTAISGRGIGLDVVREAVQGLNGSVRVETQAGTGTSLELVVPLSLASLDALMVEAAGRTMVIPLSAVRQIRRLGKSDIAWSAGSASILLDGNVVPFAPLARAVRADDSAWDNASTCSAVIMKGGGSLGAIGVDRLRGTRNVVLRPLPGLLRADPVIAGACLDSEGLPQLVLEPDRLVEAIRGGHRASAARPVQRPVVMVIDDSLTTRMLEQSILESAGYEVDLAASAEEALERAKADRHALFLVDVEMPGMDGFTFIERTRADPALRNIPAILVTSRVSPEDRQRGLKVGARAYIVKSEFDQVDLLGRIRSLVAQS